MSRMDAEDGFESIESIAIRAGAAMRAFAEAYQCGFNTEVAEHPDLAELNIQMDSFYLT